MEGIDKMEDLAVKLSDSFSNQLITEFFKFMEIKKYLKDYDATLASPSFPVDQVWHKALLYTKEYKKYCGRHMINHNPEGSKDGKNHLRYQNTLMVYRELFGIPPKRYWSESGRLVKSTKVSSRKVSARKWRPSKPGCKC